VLRSLTEIQKGATFYVTTLGLAVLLALFGPHWYRRHQTLNLFTATAGVLLMLLVVTPDGYTEPAGRSSVCTALAFATGLLPCSPRWLSSSRRTALRLCWVWCPGDSNPTP
jgi:hypothetical protein